VQNLERGAVGGGPGVHRRDLPGRAGVLRPALARDVRQACRGLVFDLLVLDHVGRVVLAVQDQGVALTPGLVVLGGWTRGARGAGCDDSPVIHGMLPVFIYMSVGLVALGVIGYFNERRRRGPEGVRRFLIWYAIAWPFMAAGLCALAFPRPHWLCIVQIGIAVIGYGVRILGFRRSRARAAARLQSDRPSPGSRS
jgi:hypothetical protein